MACLIQSLDRPKRAVAYTWCKRWQLPEGSCAWYRPDKRFLQELRAIDRDIELVWNPLLERWLLYRIARHAASPSDDQLVKEAMLTGPHGEYRPPGRWLLDWLRAHDKTRGGSIDPSLANRHNLQKLDEQAKEQDERIDRQMAPLAEHTAEEIFTHAVANRRSLHVNRT
jgi:hypothetical protein